MAASSSLAVEAVRASSQVGQLFRAVWSWALVDVVQLMVGEVHPSPTPEPPQAIQLARVRSAPAPKEMRNVVTEEAGSVVVAREPLAVTPALPATTGL